MRLLAIILNYRTAALTERAIDAALVALAAIPGSSLVVVDNDSGDGSFERLRAYATTGTRAGRVEVVASGRNGGFGAGNNHAIRRALASDAPPDLVYILNSDAFPEPEAIRELVAYLEVNPEVGLAGSAIFGTDGSPHTTAFRFPSLAGEVEDGIRLGVVSNLLRDRRVAMPTPTASGPVDWVAGASLLVRREVWERVGLFDETFFLYFEETDLCRRARAAGFLTAYVLESRVAHVGSASTGYGSTTRRMPTYWFDSRAHYFTKNHGVAYTAAADALRIAGGAVLRVRSFVQDRPLNQPPRFLLDLTAHAIGRAVRRIPWGSRATHASSSVRTVSP